MHRITAADFILTHRYGAIPAKRPGDVEAILEHRRKVQEALGKLADAVFVAVRRYGWKRPTFVKVESHSAGEVSGGGFQTVYRDVFRIDGVPVPHVLKRLLEAEVALGDLLDLRTEPPFSFQRWSFQAVEPSSVIAELVSTFDRQLPPKQDDASTDDDPVWVDHEEGGFFGDLGETLAVRIESAKGWLSDLASASVAGLVQQFRRHGWSGVRVRQYVHDEPDEGVQRAVISIEGIPTSATVLDMINASAGIVEKFDRAVGSEAGGSVQYRRAGPSSFVIVMELAYEHRKLSPGVRTVMHLPPPVFPRQRRGEPHY